MIRSFTVLAKLRMVTHHRIMLLYRIIALADLTVVPGGIQCITLACLLTRYGCADPSVSDFEKPVKEMVSSSLEPSSSAFPTKMTSGESQRDRS